MKRKCLYSFAVQCVGKCLKQPNFLPMVDCNCIRKFSWKITELDNTGKSKLDFFISNLMTVHSLHSNDTLWYFPYWVHLPVHINHHNISNKIIAQLFWVRILSNSLWYQNNNGKTENKWMCRNRSYYHYYHHHQHQNCHTPNIVEV